MYKRQSQLHLKLDTSLEPLIHEELENTGNMRLPVFNMHWKNYVLLCVFFLFVCGLVFFLSIAVCLQRFKAKVLYSAPQFHSEAVDRYKEQEGKPRPCILLGELAENCVPNRKSLPTSYL